MQNSNKYFIISIIIVVVAIVGAFVYFQGGSTNQAGRSLEGQNSAPVETNGKQPEQQMVVIKSGGFEPSPLTIKSGTVVTWKNEDAVPHIIASDPHPTHTDLPNLYSGNLSQGQSYSFKFEKTGTFGYHCHLHPLTMKGTIVVE